MKPTRVQKGDAAVLFFAAQLVEQGFVVLEPLCEALPFDLVVMYKSEFYRIQVKRAQKVKEKGRYFIPLRKITVNSAGAKVYKYSKEHTDFLVGVVVEESTSYVFPIEDVTHMSAGIQVDPTGIAKSKFVALRKIDSPAYQDVFRIGGDVVNLKEGQADR